MTTSVYKFSNTSTLSFTSNKIAIFPHRFLSPPRIFFSNPFSRSFTPHQTLQPQNAQARVEITVREPPALQIHHPRRRGSILLLPRRCTPTYSLESQLGHTGSQNKNQIIARDGPNSAGERIPPSRADAVLSKVCSRISLLSKEGQRFDSTREEGGGDNASSRCA